MENSKGGFGCNQSGATAIIYALCVLPLLAVLGVAFDLSRIATGRTTLQSALDAAVLASTRDLADHNLSIAEVQQRAIDHFEAEMQSANSDLNCDLTSIQIDRDNYIIALGSSCMMPTTLMGLIGVDSVMLEEVARAKINVTKLDLALMLDISGSMWGAKLDALKVSAKDAIGMLITPETGDRVRVALAPYSSSINIAPYADEVFAPGHEMDRCASERAGGEAFTDSEPNSGNGFLGTVPATCPDSPIQPLTFDKALLNMRIDALAAEGGTAGHLGTAWAWYLISPHWKNIWPAQSEPLNYKNNSLIKAVILMSDGDYNTTYEPSLGTSDDQARALCDGMKAEDVVVFSVAFQAPPAGESVLRDCASMPEFYFDANSTAELNDAYKTIASKLSELRLTE